MENYDLIINELKRYNDDELFYRDYYYAKQSPETLREFLSRYTKEEIETRYLICPEVNPFSFHFLTEDYTFVLKDHRSIWLQKHNRYSPLFTHSHEYFEIFYVYSGSCSHTVGGKTETLSEGTLCFIAPHIEHSVGVFDDSILINILLQRSSFDDIFFNDIRSSNVLSDFFISNLYTTSKITSLNFHIDDRELVELLLSMLLEEIVEDSYTYRILSHMMSIFFTKLVRRYGRTAVRCTADPSLNDTSLQIISFINDHYRDCTLSMVADAFHYTTAHCSRLIKAGTGRNFTDLLRSVRLRRAKSLLLSTPLSVDEISYMTGYENAATFIRLFKAEYGTTPGKFRQQG